VDEPCVGPSPSASQSASSNSGVNRESSGAGKKILRIVSQADLHFRKPSTPGEKERGERKSYHPASI